MKPAEKKMEVVYLNEWSKENAVLKFMTSYTWVCVSYLVLFILAAGFLLYCWSSRAMVDGLILVRYQHQILIVLIVLAALFIGYSMLRDIGRRGTFKRQAWPPHQ